MSDSEDPIDVADEGGDDLFGDDDEDRAPSENERVASDGLASDPEDDGHRRNEQDVDDQQVRDKVIMNVQINRHRIPKPQNDKVVPYNPRRVRTLLTIWPAAVDANPEFLEMGPRGVQARDV